jgi:hypothetical protein
VTLKDCCGLQWNVAEKKDTSSYAVGGVTDIVTGLVIDSEIISKYCQICPSVKRRLGKKVTEFFFFEARIRV